MSNSLILRRIICALITAAGGTTTVQAAVANITNPGFETGNLSGWAISSGSPQVVSSYIGVNGTTTYLPPDGSKFAIVPSEGCSPGILHQSFTVNAGDTLSGWSFYKANDYLPFDDTGIVKLVLVGPQTVTTLFSSSVSAVGN